MKLAIASYFHLDNLSLKELYCAIQSLPVSLEYKNEVTSLKNPFNHQHGKSQITVISEDTDGTLIDHHKSGNGSTNIHERLNIHSWAKKMGHAQNGKILRF